MAYYCYSTTTRELIEVSDLPLSPGDDQAVSEVSGVTKDTLLNYTWDTESCSFLAADISRKLTKRQFLKKITPIEYSAIKTAANNNPIVDYFWQLFMVADYIDLDDPDVLAGLTSLEQIGLLNSGRAAEIVS